MTFVIRSDIPIPLRSARSSKYPFEHMEVGDSFVVPADAVPARGVASLRAAIAQFRKAKDNSTKFIARTLDDGSVGVWRTL